MISLIDPSKNPSPGKKFKHSDYLASFPDAEEGEEKEHLVHTAHARNYSKGHVVELGVCTNMTINGSCE